MLIAVLLLVLAPAARAETCLSRVAAQITALRPVFPSLDGLNLVLEPFSSGEDFYQARPRSIWRSPRDRVYAVRVNMRVCSDPPPAAAEKAILAHELAHLESYSAMDMAGLLRLGWSYVVHPEGGEVKSFELKADDAAVKRGFAADLADYREWLYPRVPAEAAARKKKIYRSAEELREILTRPGT